MAISQQEMQGAQEAAKKVPGGSEVLKDVATAASIIGAASVVPGLGTIGGAVVAAVVVLGPKLFKALGFSETNKWPDRIKKLKAEPDPELRYRAAWALCQLAYRHSTMRDPPGKVRWLRAATEQLQQIRDQAFAAIPWQQRRAHGLDVGVDLKALSLPELQFTLSNLIANLSNPEFQPGMVQALIAENMAEQQTRQPLTREQLFSEARRVDMLISRAATPDARAQLQRYREQLQAEWRRRFEAPPVLPPMPGDAPPPVAAPPNPWRDWFRAAFAAQQARVWPPGPPPIPAILPPGLPPEWAAWASAARGAQLARQPTPLPPPIPLPWAA